MALLVGADPEFFLKHRRTRQNISAHGIVPGSKDNPHKLNKGAVQLDGTAVEFNIDASSSSAIFRDNIKEVLRQIREMIPEKYDFNFTPAVKYGPKYFNKIPDDHKVLGCNPDHDAYNKGAHNPLPNPVGTMRTGAGHIHIGWCKDAKVESTSHIADCMFVVRNMDAILRPIEHLWDSDTLRRKMYGKLGCFRPKSYGVEYRSLSNAWVKHPELYEFLFDCARLAYEAAESGHLLEKTLIDEKMGIKTYNSHISLSLERLYFTDRYPRLPAKIDKVN